MLVTVLEVTGWTDVHVGRFVCKDSDEP